MAQCIQEQYPDARPDCQENFEKREVLWEVLPSAQQAVPPAASVSSPVTPIRGKMALKMENGQPVCRDFNSSAGAWSLVHVGSFMFAAF